VLELTCTLIEYEGVGEGGEHVRVCLGEYVRGVQGMHVGV